MNKEIELLRHKFREGRSELFRHVTWNSPCQDLLEAHASLVDGLLKEIYEIILPRRPTARLPVRQTPGLPSWPPAAMEEGS